MAGADTKKERFGHQTSSQKVAVSTNTSFYTRSVNVHAKHAQLSSSADFTETTRRAGMRQMYRIVTVSDSGTDNEIPGTFSLVFSSHPIRRLFALVQNCQNISTNGYMIPGTRPIQTKKPHVLHNVASCQIYEVGCTNCRSIIACSRTVNLLSLSK